MGTQAQWDQLSEWLQRHGSGITTLDARGHCPDEALCLASLPCPLLRDLHLFGPSLQPGCFAACTNLTKLVMVHCYIIGSPHATSGAVSDPLTQLSVLSNLQHLGLSSTTVQSQCSATTSGPVLDLPGSLLSHLVQLTYLHLRDGQVRSAAALQHLHAVTALQHLDLDFEGCGQQHPADAALTGLQHLKHLTALKLSQVPWALNLHSMPAVTVLTALRVLLLWDSPSVDPAVLAGFSQLQELDLRCMYCWDAEGSAALLAAIGQQSQLTRLGIYPCCCCTWSTPSAAAFSALTASSHLKDLQLLRCQLPVGAWQQMFPPRRCLPELRRPRLEAYLHAAQQPNPVDQQAMVSCCPALDTLELGPQLSVATAAPLQQLTGLTHLHIDALLRVTASGLLQLTVLQQLDCIKVCGATIDPGLAILADSGVVLYELKERCEAAQQVQAG